jgi:hypothetical protein
MASKITKDIRKRVFVGSSGLDSMRKIGLMNRVLMLDARHAHILCLNASRYTTVVLPSFFPAQGARIHALEHSRYHQPLYFCHVHITNLE